MTQYAQESALNAAGRFGRFSYLAWNCLLAIVASIILGIFIAIFPNNFRELGNRQLRWRHDFYRPDLCCAHVLHFCIYYSSPT